MIPDFYITNDNGRRFALRILTKGQKYGRNDVLTWGEDRYSLKDNGIEFHDTHNSDDQSKWQFVSRYYIETLLTDHITGEPTHDYEGLNLWGGEPEWSIDGAAMAIVRQKLRQFNELGW